MADIISLNNIVEALGNANEQENGLEAIGALLSLQMISLLRWLLVLFNLINRC